MSTSQTSHRWRTWLWRLAVGALAVYSAYITWVGAGFLLPLISIVWGANSGMSMSNGIRNAPQKNWERPTPKVIGWLVRATLITLLFLPAIGSLLFWPPLVGLASAWLVLVSAAGGSLFVQKRRGPVKIPAGQGAS
jgi:hypothetical protein